MPRPKPRTAEDAENSEANDSTDESPQLTLGAPAGRKRVRTGRPTKDRSQIVRATYESTEEMEWVLVGLARHLKMKKYDLVFKLLAQGADAYDVTAFLRTAFVHIHGVAAKSGQTMSA